MTLRAYECGLKGYEHTATIHHGVAEWVIYIQAILAGLWFSCWLFDHLFESALQTFGLSAAFKDYILGPYWQKKRKEREVRP